MKIQSGNTLAISLFLTIVPDLGAQASIPQITVGFVNNAAMDPKALRQGLEFAATTLRWTGVALLSVDCSLEGASTTPPCSGFTGPNQVSIRLVRESQKGAKEIDLQRLGFADPLDARPGSGSVYLFCETIKTAARDQSVPLRHILGVVITHEIGHLLIAPGHSDAGIMRGRLEGKDWCKASQGKLRFTREQANIIREGILSRSRQPLSVGSRALGSN